MRKEDFIFYNLRSGQRVMILILFSWLETA